MTNVEIGLSITVAIQIAAAVVWAVRKEGDLRVLQNKLDNLEMVTEHLTRAGEGIKGQLSVIEPKLSAIDTKLEFIIKQLDK